MYLKVKDINQIIEAIAPSKLKESYDNVGLLVGSSEKNVSSILVALDCTHKVIEEAKNKGCSLILTHHPLIFRKPSTVTTESLLGDKLIKLIKNDIDLYSAHTNLDSVKGGINDIIMNLLGFKENLIIDEKVCEGDIYSGSGIGRIAELEEKISLVDLCDKVKKVLGVECLRYSGENETLISKIAVLNGSGTGYFERAKEMGADCIITGDTTYHYVSDYVEEGVVVIDAGHFATEWPAMKIFAKELENNIKKSGYENSVFLSEEVKDPYKYR